MRQLRFLTVVVLIVLVSSAARPPTLARSDVARCTRGGWQWLARPETPHLPFGSQSECITYARSGGGPIAVVPVIGPSFTYVEGDRSQCNVNVNMANFSPWTTYTVSLEMQQGDAVTPLPNSLSVTTNERGRVSFSMGSIPAPVTPDVYINVLAGGYQSDFTLLDCSEAIS